MTKIFIKFALKLLKAKKLLRAKIYQNHSLISLKFKNFQKG